MPTWEGRFVQAGRTSNGTSDAASRRPEYATAAGPGYEGADKRVQRKEARALRGAVNGKRHPIFPP